MISNYYTFQHLVSTFNSGIAGKRIREAYSQEPDEICVAFEDDPRVLVFLCRPDVSVAYLHDGRSRARRNSVDLLGGCIGARVNAVVIKPFDRILHFSLDTGSELAAVLYGPRANILLIGDSGIVLDSFKNPKNLRGSTLQPPPVPAADGFEAFRQACGSPDDRLLVNVIRKSFPGLGATLALESVTRAGIDRALKTATIDPAGVPALENAIRSVFADLDTPAPRVYTSGEGVPGYFSLIPLRLAGGMSEEKFADIHRAIRSYLAGRSSRSAGDREKDSLVAPLRLQLEKGTRTLRAIETDSREAERAEMYEQFGSALMAGLPELVKGMSTFESDIRGERVSIPLDPALSPVQNAQRYFEKAKRAKSAGVESARRIAGIAARIRRLEKLLAEAEQLPPGELVEHFAAEHATELDEVGLGPKSRERESLPFRIFTVEGGFEVLAGKNGANNDLLTLRYAKPDDLWFHARGGSGSHVVLRIHSGKGEPGKRACEQAAGIAAYYSKMKNAGTVPVAMTEKRYVRKPRGAPPGTVMIEREKVIFARPALPRDGAV